MATPWVGITTSIDPGRRLRRGVPYLYAPRSYAAAVTRAGGTPVLLVPGPVQGAGEALSRCDALVLSGGDQLPATFASGAAPKAPERDAEDAERIAWERALIDAAVARDLPVLGVCYGMQLLNLHFGGSLRAAFLPDDTVHGGSGVVTEHAVRVQAATRVFAWIGDGARVASSHHQAVDQVAPGFRVAASSSDGVVEAIEDPDREITGVEWHPELDETGGAIYGALVQAAESVARMQGSAP